MLLGIATKLLEKFHDEKPRALTPALIENGCPGLSVGVKSLYTAWWTVTGRMPRRAKLSDFPDALHAMYAPYVDIFRVDSFMAPFIDRYARKFGTRVVPKLMSLISPIQAALQAYTNRGEALTISGHDGVTPATSNTNRLRTANSTV